MSDNTPRILRRKEVQQRLGGISRSTLYRWIGAGQFIKPIHFGANSVGWFEEDVSNWLMGLRDKSSE